MESFDGRCEAMNTNKGVRCPHDAKAERDGHMVCGGHKNSHNVKWCHSAQRFRQLERQRDEAKKICTHTHGLELIHHQLPMIVRCRSCMMYLDLDPNGAELARPKTAPEHAVS